MVVLRPLSWMRGVRGAPTLVKFSVCCGSKALHSGPWSNTVSFRTVPHTVQICSPVAGSVIMSVFPHSHCSCRAILFTCVLVLCSMIIIDLYVGECYNSLLLENLGAGSRILCSFYGIFQPTGFAEYEFLYNLS